MIVHSLVSACVGDYPLAMRSHNPVLHVHVNSSLLGQGSIIRSLCPKRIASRRAPSQQQHNAWSNSSAADLCYSSGRRSHATHALVAEAAPAAPAAPAAEPDQPDATVAADTLLVVESKTKAVKIQKFLGESYKVKLLTHCVQAPPNHTHKQLIQAG